jgi:hypothetical protein
MVIDQECWASSDPYGSLSLLLAQSDTEANCRAWHQEREAEWCAVRQPVGSGNECYRVRHPVVKPTPQKYLLNEGVFWA